MQRGAFVVRVLVGALAAALLLGCSRTERAETSRVVRIGHFPNVTHVHGLVAHALSLEGKDVFAEHLGPDVRVEYHVFHAGPAAMEALLAGSIDVTYVGPNPAINAYVRTNGTDVRVLSGATRGGSGLVVRKGSGLAAAADFKGKRIATPQLGNTQDVALRYWLKKNGLTANKDGSGDVKVVPQENAQTLQTFAQGDIDGAWVPEPYASRLILENKGERLLDEKSLWPGGKFVITNLLVSQEYEKKHPDQVKKLLQGVVEATDYINQNKADAEKVTNDALAKLSGKPLKQDVLTAAFKEIDFTTDPVASSLVAGAAHAEEIGLLEKTDLDGIYNLAPLNDVLKAGGKAQVSDR